MRWSELWACELRHLIFFENLNGGFRGPGAGAGTSRQLMLKLVGLGSRGVLDAWANL